MTPDDRPAAPGPILWPLAEVEGRRVVAFDAADVERGRLLLAELERMLLTTLGLIQAGDKANARKGVQDARSTLARWGGELSALKDRLG